MNVWHGLTVSDIDLDRVLAPAANHLDNCWWYLGGAGMSFPWVKPPRRVEPPEPPPAGRQARKKARNQARRSPPSGAMQFDPEDWQRYQDETNAAAAEYGQWLDDSVDYRVGKPGFFKRYAAGMDGDWQMYFASDEPQLPVNAFDECVRRFDGNWFEAPPDDLPRDICLITRDVDHAYLDLFFRDEWMFKSVWAYLDAKGMTPGRYKPVEIPERWR